MGGMRPSNYYRDMAAPKTWGLRLPLRSYVNPFRKLWSLHQVGHRKKQPSERLSIRSRAGCWDFLTRRFVRLTALGLTNHANQPCVLVVGTSTVYMQSR